MSSKLNEQEIRTLVAMILEVDEPDDVCTYALIGVTHPDHLVSIKTIAPDDQVLNSLLFSVIRHVAGGNYERY